MLKRQFSQLYADKTRILFDHLKTRTYQEQTFTYRHVSLFLRKEIKSRQSFTPVEMIIYGFLCPDHEF